MSGNYEEISGEKTSKDDENYNNASMNTKVKEVTKKAALKTAEALDDFAERVENYSTDNSYIDESKDRLSNGIRTTSDYLKTTELDLNQIMESTRNHIKNHPLKYAFGALLIGVVLSQLRARNRS